MDPAPDCWTKESCPAPKYLVLAMIVLVNYIEVFSVLVLAFGALVAGSVFFGFEGSAEGNWKEYNENASS